MLNIALDNVSLPPNRQLFVAIRSALVRVREGNVYVKLGFASIMLWDKRPRGSHDPFAREL